MKLEKVIRELQRRGIYFDLRKITPSNSKIYDKKEQEQLIKNAENWIKRNRLYIEEIDHLLRLATQMNTLNNEHREWFLKRFAHEFRNLHEFRESDYNNTNLGKLYKTFLLKSTSNNQKIEILRTMKKYLLKEIKMAQDEIKSYKMGVFPNLK